MRRNGPWRLIRLVELFDEALAESERPRAQPLVANDRLCRLPANADRAALAALEAALVDARAAADDRPPLVMLASCLGQLGAPPPPSPAKGVSLRRRGGTGCDGSRPRRRASALVAYRVAIDDLLDWSDAHGRTVLEEPTISTT